MTTNNPSSTSPSHCAQGFSPSSSTPPLLCHTWQSLPPIPFNIIRHLTLDERNQLYQYIATITNQPLCEGHQPSVPSGSAASASGHTTNTQHPSPNTPQTDIIQLSFYVIITIATLLSALVIYNSCINN